MHLSQIAQKSKLYKPTHREKTPVGGISVKDHFEINLVPLTIGITHSLYKKIMAFCFHASPIDPNDPRLEPPRSHGKGHQGSGKKSSFYVDTPPSDVELMRERAQQNKLFVYIKIPEVPICVNYKGEKEKNKLLDVSDFVLQVS